MDEKISKEKTEPPGSRNSYVVLPIILFILGVLEYILITWLTDSVANARRFSASISVLIYIILWYIVGREVILGGPQLAIFYACGCSLGTFITCKDTSGKSILERLWKWNKKT